MFMEEKSLSGLVCLDASELQTRGGLTFKEFIQYAIYLEPIIHFVTNYVPQFVKGFKDGYYKKI